MDAVSVVESLVNLPGTKRHRFGDAAVKVPCPCHEDRHASCIVWAHDGRVFAKCFAGCDPKEILRRLNISNKMEQTNSTAAPRGRVAMEYLYYDADGNAAVKKIRYEPKAFSSATLRGEEWIPGVGQLPAGVGLYNAPILREGDGPVIFNEGEKAADACQKIGVVGTSHFYGSNASKRLTESDVALLRGRQVIIVADNDGAGEAFAASLHAALLDKDISATVVSPAVSDDKADAYDHIAAGHGLDDFRPRPDLHGVETFRSFDKVASEPVEFAWHPYIPYGQVTVVTGDGDLGKSWLLCAIAASASKGLTLDNRVLAGPVGSLFLAAEDSTAHVLRPRAIQLGADLPLLYDMPGHPMLDTEDGVAQVDSVLQKTGVRLLFVDPLFAYVGATGDINSPVYARSVMKSLVKLAKRRDIAVILMIHSNKQGQMLASVEWRNASRSLLSVQWHPNVVGLRLVQHTKHNYSQRGLDFAYEFFGGVPFYQFENVPKPEWPKRRQS